MVDPERPGRKYPYWPDLTDDEGDALTAYFDVICGDCVEGRCHWGGERSRESIAAVKAGREYVDATFGRCGCDRHADSVLARRYQVAGAGERTTVETALAWRARVATVVEVRQRTHRCGQCGHDCASTDHHIRCCGTENQHRNTAGSYCTGHPCPACRGPDFEVLCDDDCECCAGGCNDPEDPGCAHCYCCCTCVGCSYARAGL